MTHHHPGPFAATLFTLLLPAGALAAPPDRDKLPEFTVQSLGGLDIGQSHATAVNDQGSIVGGTSMRVGNEFRFEAFFRDKQGIVVPVGDLPGGGVHTALTSLNNHDWAVGSSDGGTQGRTYYHAVVWNEHDGLIDLGTAGFSSSADEINDHNQVVGYVDSNGPRRAFVWEPESGRRTLPVPAGAGTSQASGINNKGTIVGHTYTVGESGQHATLWTRDRQYRDLGELPGGFEEAAAFAVNEKDHVAGYSITENDHRAFYWSDETGMIDIGTLPGTQGSVAHGINKDDWVVGFASNPGPTSAMRGFLWTADWGMLNLDDLLAPGSDDWKVYGANWVGDQGDILGVGQLGDEYHMILLSPRQGSAPNPEPGASLLLVAAGAGAMLRRGRR
jgi:probable HAF family extracellular repeat protein